MGPLLRDYSNAAHYILACALTVDSNQKMLYFTGKHIFGCNCRRSAVDICVFIYDDIQWGNGANIGFDAGDGSRFFKVADARTGLVLTIDEGSNIGVTGLYIYHVDLCSVLGPNNGEKAKAIREICWHLSINQSNDE